MQPVGESALAEGRRLLKNKIFWYAPIMEMHPLSTSTMTRNRAGQILPNHFRNDRVAIKKRADSFKLLDPGMVDVRDHEGSLNLSFCAILADPTLRFSCYFNRSVSKFYNHLTINMSRLKCPLLLIFLHLSHLWMGMD